MKILATMILIFLFAFLLTYKANKIDNQKISEVVYEVKTNEYETVICLKKILLAHCGWYLNDCDNHLKHLDCATNVKAIAIDEIDIKVAVDK